MKKETPTKYIRLLLKVSDTTWTPNIPGMEVVDSIGDHL